MCAAYDENKYLGPNVLIVRNKLLLLLFPYTHTHHNYLLCVDTTCVDRSMVDDFVHNIVPGIYSCFGKIWILDMNPVHVVCLQRCLQMWVVCRLKFGKTYRKI